MPLSTYIQIKRLKWAGYVIRLEDYHIPKKNSGGSVIGKRPVGRPRNRWEDNVLKNAVSLLHIRNWKSAAEIRQNWSKNTEVAMTQIWAKAP
jgi:hypothetical protein